MSVFSVAAYAVWKLLNEMKMLHILKKYITNLSFLSFFLYILPDPLSSIIGRCTLYTPGEFDYFYVPSTVFQLCRGGSSLVEPVLS